ncbi:MAG TPA: tetratricopeptide repeat protein [Rhodanobacteraceae bacterium]|nr:tetratricopeptide repeat protein [Rhodanobacteraceae bacterium]
MASRGFWRELKRRHVYRVAAAYAIVGWLLVQVATQVFPVFHLPDWIDQTVVLLILLGFPIALVLAWAFDATPQGIVRTDAQDSVDAQTARRPRRAGIAVGLIGVLIALLAGGVWWHTERAGAVRNARVTSAQRLIAKSPATLQVASASATPSPVSTQPIPAKSVAVLPFVNMSGDPKEDYFSDGITEEILDALAQVPNLKVAARTSAFAFKGKAEDLRKVGEVLDVATVLEGSVQKSGDEVRITAQLIDTRSGYHLWSEKYDRKLTSVFAVEDEISKAIADKLQVQLAGGSGQTLVAQKTVDPRAHDFYLRGLTLLAARSVSEAAGAFQQAVTIDPGYAQAWAALAEAQVLLPSYGPAPAQKAYADSLSSSQRALALDPDNALAYVAQGMVYSNQIHWAEADTALRHALALAPGDAEVLNQYAQFLDAVGQLEPALAVLDRALQRDPLSGTSAAIRLQLRMILHRVDADTADAQIKAIVAAHPASVFVHRTATLIYLNLHRYSEAEAQSRRAAELNGEDPEVGALLIRGITDPAYHARAVESLETSTTHFSARRDPIVRALFLMWLGERDLALTALDDAANGNSTIPQLLWHPEFDPVRNDPRFKAALKKMGLPYTPDGAAKP